MKYVEAFSMTVASHYTPQQGEISLFLAGGITGCFDWQKEAVKLLDAVQTGFFGPNKEDLVVLNPRREHWPMNDPAASEKQIEWEFEHLQKATMILFWFPPETLCPITLFEYGKWLVKNKPIFVGCDPEYKRLEDVKTQTRLERPYMKVHTSLQAVIDNVVAHRFH